MNTDACYNWDETSKTEQNIASVGALVDSTLIARARLMFWMLIVTSTIKLCNSVLV